MMDFPTPLPLPLETPETRIQCIATATVTSSSRSTVAAPSKDAVTVDAGTVDVATVEVATVDAATVDTVTENVTSEVSTTEDVPTGSQEEEGCKMKPLQCYCGLMFENGDAKVDHLGIIHTNNHWCCGGRWMNSLGKEIVCTHVTHDRFQLWTHYWKIHEQRYQYYCDVEGCDFLGSDKKWVVDKHKPDKHSALKLHCCSKCGKDFGKKHSLCEHKVICQLDKSIKPLSVAHALKASGLNLSSHGTPDRNIRKTPMTQQGGIFVVHVGRSLEQSRVSASI